MSDLAPALAFVRSLSSDSDTFLRELLLAAYASLQRRGLPDGSVTSGGVWLSVSGQRLVVEDNGAGLTEGELESALVRLSQPPTPRERNPQTHAEVVCRLGQLGLGLLSSLRVAERVVLETRARAGPPLRWDSDSGRVQPGSRAEVGTTVTLVVRSSEAAYLHPGRLRRMVIRYADALPVPVYVVPERQKPCNRGAPPWELPKGELPGQAIERWWLSRFGARPAFALTIDIPVTVQREGRTLEGRVVGLLGWPERAQGEDAGLADLPPDELPLDLYVERVLVTSRQRALLPDWSGPMVGALGCDLLAPVPSRDDVLFDDALDAVRSALGTALLRGLASALSEDSQQDALRAALEVHGEHLLPLLAAAPDKVLVALGPHATLPTDRGPRPLSEVLDASPVAPDGLTEVHAWTDRALATPMLLLCAARQIPVVAMEEPAVASFLERYLERARARLVAVDRAGSSSLLLPLRGDQGPAWRPLQALAAEALRPETCAVQIVRFAPSEIPALLLAGDASPVLYLNADAAAVQVLRERSLTPADDATLLALRLLHAGALLLSGQRLATEDRGRLFADAQRAAEMLLGVD